MKLTDKQKQELSIGFSNYNIGYRAKHGCELTLVQIRNWWLSQIEQLEPELPSDEEIEKRAKKYVLDYWGEGDSRSYEHDHIILFIDGAEWMRSQLKGKIA